MTKQEILDYLYSLQAGTHQIGNKDVVVTPYHKTKLTLAKVYHIIENGNYVEFKLVLLRTGVHMEDLIIKGNIQSVAAFLAELMPQNENPIKRESLSILLLIFLLIGIICTPLTIVTFIYDESWGWGLLCFTTIIFAWASWFYRKLGELE